MQYDKNNMYIFHLKSMNYFHYPTQSTDNISSNQRRAAPIESQILKVLAESCPYSCFRNFHKVSCQYLQPWHRATWQRMEPTKTSIEISCRWDTGILEIYSGPVGWPTEPQLTSDQDIQIIVPWRRDCCRNCMHIQDYDSYCVLT